MRKLVLLLMLVGAAHAAPQIESMTSPNFVLMDENGVPVEGVSNSQTTHKVLMKAAQNGPGVYTYDLEIPGKIVITNDVLAVEPEPEPTPTPEPAPEPEPEPQPTPTPEPEPVPEPISGSFAECLDAYALGASGWCQLSSQTFDSIRLTNEEASAFGVKGSGGSKGVMIAWTGAAIDRDRGIMYFWGGGHNDYYGNEMYAYHYLTDVWERLTDPAPYDHYYPSDSYGFCMVPDPQKSPPSAHSYDGIEFHPERGTLWLTNQGTSANCSAVAPSGTLIALEDSKSGIWEFNPSRTEIRAGLAPLTWRRLGTNWFGYPRSEWVNGKMLMGSNTQIFEVSADENNQFVLGAKVAGNPSAGQGVLTALDDTLYFYMNGGFVWSQNLTTGLGEKIIGDSVQAPTWGQMECGKVCLSWAGYEDLSLLDPVAKTWTRIDHDAGPVNDSQLTGRGRVYSKWRYLPKYDVFIGVSSNSQPVYLYKYQAPDVPVALPEPDEGSQDYDLALNIEDSGPFH